MSDLDIVIVNWNTGCQLQDCLQSIPGAVKEPVLQLKECVVVDNASEDGSVGDLDMFSMPLVVIRNPVNKGFATACNQGAKVGKSEYILFLNPDSRLFSDSLVKALYFMEEKQNEQVGILGIQLVDENGVVHRNTARFPTPKSLLFQMLGLDRLWPHHFPAHFMTDWNHQDNREVDQVAGAFYLVRRKVFEELHGFDERFFMYFDELDFAFRASRAGWKSYYLAGAQAFHHGGGASDQVRAKRLYYLFSSRVLYVAKHYGVPSAIGILVASFLVEFWARLGWSLVHMSRQNIVATIQAYWMFLLNLPGLLRNLGK